ncbi:glycosyltransferase family 2 protein [Candidatus Woesearchaeota archaeon]|nr:glycosyltransferase family 2 protein [Candidatus Woesearchaeota archaeon]
MNKVSYITVNYNGLSDTLEWIESIYDNSYSNFEIIIVDNCSKESPKLIIQKKYPTVKVIESKQNLGFAGGNNLGIQHATGEFLFLINNDTVISDGCIEGLLETIQSQPEVGGVSPMLLYYHNKNYIQFAGFTAINPYTGRNSTLGEMEEENGQYSSVTEIPYMHGAAMFLSNKVVQDAGPIPDFYFLYYEELDWSIRIKEKGYRLLFQPEAKVYHKESVSVGKDSRTKVFYMTRNRMWFMRRNYSRINYLYFFMFYTFLAMPKKLSSYLIQGNIDKFWIALKSYFYGIFNFLPQYKVR